MCKIRFFPSCLRTWLAASVLLHYCVAPTQLLAGQDSYTVVEKGANQQIWAGTIAQTNAAGVVSYKTNFYTELATGLNHFTDGEWVTSSEEIQLTGTGGAATNSQHQVSFAANINSSGSISIIMPRGGELSGTILGLSLYDSAQDKTVVVAQVQDSFGQVLPTLNQVIYTNALGDSQSDFTADVLYTQHRGRFEQDVVLHQQTPDPAELGLNPDTTVIQVWTEFVRGNDPNVFTNHVMAEGWRNGTRTRHSMNDETLNFNGMCMGPGLVSGTGGVTNTADSSVALLIPVTKHWVRTNNQRFLVEEVPYNAVAPQLNLLPAPAPRNTTNSQQSFFRPPSGKHKIGTFSMAKESAPPRAGLVLDYNLINTTVTNFTFQSDTTYYVSGTDHLYGTTTIEGGTVIKVGVGATLEVDQNEVDWKTSPYRPAIFTATNDNSVGVSIGASTNVPTLSTNATYLYCLQGGVIHDARFSYAWNAYSGSLPSMEVRDCQFIDCDNVIIANSATTNLSLKNVLITMQDSVNNTSNYCSCIPGAIVTFPYNVKIEAENLTADLGSSYLVKNITSINTSYSSLSLTNCIVIGSNLTPYYYYGSASGLPVYTNYSFCASAKPANLFQTVGDGSYYLANTSLARGIGTTNISTNTLADLANKTTYPPVVYCKEYLPNYLTLFPQAQRDTNGAPDLGYHYDPIDFAFGGVALNSNGFINVLPGTTIGCFDTNSSGFVTSYGLWLQGGGASFVSQGTPISLNRIVSINTVQECSTNQWVPLNVNGSMIASGNGNPNPISFNCRFTDFSIIAQDCAHIGGFAASAGLPITFQDCQFHGGVIDLFNGTMSFINCLHERVYEDLYSDYNRYTDTLTCRNNLWIGGTLSLGFNTSGSLMQNNMFYDATITGVSPSSGYAGGYNAYYNSTRLAMTNSTDKYFSSDPGFQVGPLGNYYQPTNSIAINAGSTTADLVGLYHYTTQTNQVKEANSAVDIGYHYVALNSYGQADDTDGDGFPDYVEDANGNGLVDSGETDWEDANDLGLNVLITLPKSGSIIP